MIISRHQLTVKNELFQVDHLTKVSFDQIDQINYFSVDN